jgi:hypothetical protein
MKPNKYYQSLERIIAQTLEETMARVIILVGKQYALFNRYSITRHDGYVTVFRRSDAQYFEFTEIKHALTWVILDKHNKYSERNRILTLDRELTSVRVDQQIHRRLRAKYTGDLRSIYTMKLQLDRDKEKRIVAECDKYITMANKYHLQGIKK